MRTGRTGWRGSTRSSARAVAGRTPWSNSSGCVCRSTGSGRPSSPGRERRRWWWRSERARARLERPVRRAPAVPDRLSRAQLRGARGGGRRRASARAAAIREALEHDRRAGGRDRPAAGVEPRRRRGGARARDRQGRPPGGARRRRLRARRLHGRERRQRARPPVPRRSVVPRQGIRHVLPARHGDRAAPDLGAGARRAAAAQRDDAPGRQHERLHLRDRDRRRVRLEGGHARAWGRDPHRDARRRRLLPRPARHAEGRRCRRDRRRGRASALEPRRRRVSERFLVTGAYGCIGAWVLRQLVREGVHVIAADFATDDSRVAALLEPEERSDIGFVRVDVSRPDEVAALFQHEPTHVIHLAALQVPACRADPVRGAQVNVVGTAAVFAAAAAAGVQTPVLYASSAAAFAAADDGTDPSGHPDTHYGVFKLANEETARLFAAESGLASIGLRPYVVYGPGRDQGLTSAPTLAMQAAARGERFTIPYSGRSQLQFARDAAAAFVAAARAPFDGAVALNVPGLTVSVDEIVAAVERAVPEAVGTIDVTGPPLPFPPELDSSAFGSVVGDLPVTPLDEGVAATIEHFR